MDGTIHPAAIHHLPPFITPPGGTDWLFYIMVGFLIVAVLAVGNLYFQLHALPERMAHRTNTMQMQFVAVLALLALFTHNHVFWIAGLLLALVQFPDFSSPLNSIAESLARLSGRADPIPPEAPPPPDPAGPIPPHPAGPVPDLAAALPEQKA